MISTFQNPKLTYKSAELIRFHLFSLTSVQIKSQICAQQLGSLKVVHK